MGNIALVLEGGGMRSIFTAGVLDCFMNNGIEFPYTIAVSGGCINGLSYMSNQPGRNKDIMIPYLQKNDYISFGNYLKSGSFIDFNSLLSNYDQTEIPFNFPDYKKSNNRFVIVTTNCRTGEAVYFEEYNNKERLFQLSQASASLPFICPFTIIDNVPYCDGGVADAIPYKQAISEGFTKLVIVLTQDENYRKPIKHLPIPRLLLNQYPKLRKTLSTRRYRYNQMLEDVKLLESQGQAIVIRPDDTKQVDTLTKDVSSLQALYCEGVRAASDKLESIFLLFKIYNREY